MLQDTDLISIQEVRAKVEAAWHAFQKFRQSTQEQVDAVVEAVATAARAQARNLAELAVQETGYGNAKDKLTKNLLAADLLPRTMRAMRTIGIVREIPEQKLVEIATPMGVVAAVLPTTNPTSTAIYKTLISLKAGNAIVLSPHPRAKASTCATAGVLIEAAQRAGAPEGIIQCINNSTLEGTNELMRHRRTSVILSTGGSGIVRAAYSSGKPAFGVGPGNVPVLLDSSAEIGPAVAKVVEGKSFDYGTVCSSEQTIVAEQKLRDPIIAALKAQKAFLCDAGQAQALARLLITPSLGVNPQCVGQAPERIARMAGFDVPAGTSVLVVEIAGIGKEHPLSAEKLSPVLSLYFVSSFATALDACEGILRFGGLGHTCVIHATDDARVREYAVRMPAFRVLVNTPAPQGSTGITTNVFPAMTLGCGALAGNSTSDNIGPQHLMNIKRLAYVARNASEAFQAPDPGPDVPDRNMIVEAVERYLSRRGVAVEGSASKSEPAVTAPQQPAPPCPARKTESASLQAQPPALQVVDFVCENDVRTAIQQGRKIFVGPKTIVTPSARDLANVHDAFVMTEAAAK